MKAYYNIAISGTLVRNVSNFSLRFSLLSFAKCRNHDSRVQSQRKTLKYWVNWRVRLVTDQLFKLCFEKRLQSHSLHSTVWIQLH